MLFLLCTASVFPYENGNNKLEFKANFVSNYILHVYCVAGIGEYKLNQDYYEKYKSTIDSLDLANLKKHESKLAFADGKTGQFTYFCLFLPSYLELKDEKEFSQYYSIIINALERNNFQEFLKTYNINKEDPFIANNLNFFLNLPDSLHKKFIAPLTEDFKLISAIFIRNVPSYKQNVWPQVKTELENKAQYYTEMLKGENLIKKWEDFTGLKFNQDYQIFLLYANKKGPSANSMSLNKNMFYYNFPDSYFHDFISHEIGTHLIFPLVWNDRRAQEYLRNGNNKVYNATESLCQFYNKIILGREKLEYNMSDYNSAEYEKIYKKYYNKNILHTDLVIKGLEEF
jgi:hypothetical protein